MDLLPTGKRKLRLTVAAVGVGMFASITIQVAWMLGVTIHPTALAYFEKSMDLLITYLIVEGVRDVAVVVRNPGAGLVPLPPMAPYVPPRAPPKPHSSVGRGRLEDE